MQVTKTLYLYEGTKYGNHSVFTRDVTGDPYFEEYILLTTKEVTFDVPDDINIVALKVAALDREIAKVTDQFGLQLKRLKDKRAKLLCIENAVPA